jgi:hypothetical protein
MKLIENANKLKRRFKSSKTLTLFNNLATKADNIIRGNIINDSKIETGKIGNSAAENAR